MDSAWVRDDAGKAAMSLSNARWAAAFIRVFPSALDWAISKPSSSAASRAGTCVRQPFSISQPPSAPRWAMSGTPAGMRTFRVSRMRAGVVLPQPIERPPGFDLAVYWKSVTERLSDQNQRLKTTLALSPKGVMSLRGWTSMVPAAEPNARPPIDKDWSVYDVEFDSFPHARFAVLGLGANAIVLAPEDMRRDVEAEIAHMAERSRVPS